jgi:hypothetical protein
MDGQSFETNSTRSKLLIPPTRATLSVSLTYPLRRLATQDRQVIAGGMALGVELITASSCERLSPL